MGRIVATNTPSNPSRLVEVNHREALAFVASEYRETGPEFERRSCLIVPDAWRAVSGEELAERVERVLEGQYEARFRASVRAQPGDLNRMVLLGGTCRVVDESELAGRPWKGAFSVVAVDETGATTKLYDDASIEARLSGRSA